jgi:hypothetical protein
MALDDLQLRLSVFDKDVVGDDFLGGCEVDLTTILGQGDSWRVHQKGRVVWRRPLVDLNGKLKKDKAAQRQIIERQGKELPDVYGVSGLGFVSLRVGFKDPAQPPPPTPPCPGVLTLHIAGCSNLLAADRTGLSDPYITACLGNLEQQRTRVQPKTLNPKFEESFRWRLEPGQVSIADLRSLTLKLWDEDTIITGVNSMVSDDFLGEVAIDLIEELGEGVSWLTEEAEWERPLSDAEKLLDQDKAMRKQLKQRVQAGDDNPYGTIRLKVNFKEPSRRPSGRLQVVVLTCRGLLAADANGLSDPFVEVAVGGDPKPQRTHTVMRTLNPRFNRAELPESKQTVLEFELGDDVPPDQLVLSAAVYDWDQLSADDLLGMVEIDLEKEFHAGWGHGWTKPKEWPLLDSRKGQLQNFADRSVKKQIKRRRDAGVHPFGFVRLKLQFIADVPPAPTKLAIQASANAELGTEFPVEIYVADASGWKKEPLHLSLDVLPAAIADAPTRGAVAAVPSAILSTGSVARNLAELRGMMGLTRAHSQWMSVLESSEPTANETLLPRTSMVLAPEGEDGGELHGFQADIERGGSASSLGPPGVLAALPGMVHSGGDGSNSGRGGALSLKHAAALASHTSRIKRKVRVRKSREDTGARTPVQLGLD